MVQHTTARPRRRPQLCVKRLVYVCYLWRYLITDWVLCFSGRILRVSLIQHSFYVGVVRDQYGKMELKYPESGYCQGVLRPQVVFNVPLHYNTDRKLSLFKQVGKPIQSSQFIVRHNTIWSDMCHIGCCIYDCNDHNGLCIDGELKI